MKKNIKKSIYMYILFWISILLFYKSWILDTYKVYLILWFVLIIIKDVLQYFFQIQKVTQIHYNTSQIFSSENTLYYKILFTNRHYIFPTVLIIYMIILLISNTHIFWLDSLSIFQMIDKNIFLWITILSWILTIFKENNDEFYKQEFQSTKWVALNLILTIILSILWTYIILIQTQFLWWLTYPISIISGILIFLVWISILDENEWSDVIK